MCHFDTSVYCKLINTIALANITIPSYNYHFFFVVRIFRISFSNIQLYDISIISYNHQAVH